MKICIVNDVVGPLSGEKENFWDWLIKELPAEPISFTKLKIPLVEAVKGKEIIINNDLWGLIFPGYFTITILQNNYIEMKKLLGIDYSQVIEKQEIALKNSNIRVAVSNHISSFYKHCGEFEVIPIGTNTDIFKQMDKTKLRLKYNIPEDKTVKIWVGSHHQVKGFDLVDTSKDFWILVFKDYPSINLPNTKVFCRISQEQIAELYNCADYFVSTSRCESLGLAPIEAMFCGIPVITKPVGIFWDWNPPMKNPRKEAFDNGLDKATCIAKWRRLIENCRYS